MLCAALLLINSGSVIAQEAKMIDVGKLTCKDFFTRIAELKGTGSLAAITWLEGYASGVRGDTIIRPESFQEFTWDLVAASMATGSAPTTKILDVVKKVEKSQTGEGLDIGEMTCAGFFLAMEIKPLGASLGIIWLDGYLSGVSGDTRFSYDFFETLTLKLALECKDNPYSKITEAAKKVGLEKK